MHDLIPQEQYSSSPVLPPQLYKCPVLSRARPNFEYTSWQPYKCPVLSETSLAPGQD